jgi:hypothetical protein
LNDPRLGTLLIKDDSLQDPGITGFTGAETNQSLEERSALILRANRMKKAPEK